METNLGDANILNIENLAKLENIPEDLRPLSHDIWDIAEQVYGIGNIGALFWEGSIPRGDFRPGLSDVDFVAIIKRGIKLDQGSELQERVSELEPKWLELGVARLDVFAMSEADIYETHKQKSVFILATDAIQILGDESYDLSFAVPDTKLELVELLNSNLAGHVDWAFSEDRIGTNSKWISKMAIRAIYGIAMINGAEYERRITKYRAGVEQCAPEYIALFDKLNSVMEKAWTDNDIEYFRAEIASIVESLGLIFNSSSDLIEAKAEQTANKVRRAVPGDAMAIVSLKRRAWLDSYVSAEHDISIEDIENNFPLSSLENAARNWEIGLATESGSTDRATFVSIVNDKVVGFTSPCFEDNQRRVGALYVDPEYQNKGIGSQLLQKALNWHEASEDIYLHVVSYNENAIKLYEKYGFERTGKEIPEQYDDEQGIKLLPETEMVRRSK